MKHIKTFEKFSLTKYLFGDKDEDTYVKDDDTFLADKDIKFGEKSESVKKLQQSLEKLGFKLYSYGVDSVIGNETWGQLTALFKFLKKPHFDKFVDDKELLELRNKTVTADQQELVHDLASDDELKNEISAYFKKEEERIAKLGIVSSKRMFQHIQDPRAFVLKVQEICKKLQIPNPNWLMLVMWKESKLNPKARNPKSQATGLIQWMPSTAKDYGTTVDEIMEMDEMKQLDLVYKYYKRFTGKLTSVQDVYAVTFFPAAIGKDDEWVFREKGVSPEKIASQNQVIDLNKDGEITKGEFDDYVTQEVPKELKSKI